MPVDVCTEEDVNDGDEELSDQEAFPEVVWVTHLQESAGIDNEPHQSDQQSPLPVVDKRPGVATRLSALPCHHSPVYTYACEGPDWLDGLDESVLGDGRVVDGVSADGDHDDQETGNVQPHRRIAD
ncbi:hypothetical protein MRB53_041852 [Persea americana]|nr:hypothetical protein MRB53_041852 [Persea americana]